MSNLETIENLGCVLCNSYECKGHDIGSSKMDEVRFIFCSICKLKIQFSLTGTKDFYTVCENCK